MAVSLSAAPILFALDSLEAEQVVFDSIRDHLLFSGIQIDVTQRPGEAEAPDYPNTLGLQVQRRKPDMTLVIWIELNTGYVVVDAPSIIPIPYRDHLSCVDMTLLEREGALEPVSDALTRYWIGLEDKFRAALRNRGAPVLRGHPPELKHRQPVPMRRLLDGDEVVIIVWKTGRIQSGLEVWEEVDVKLTSLPDKRRRLALAKEALLKIMRKSPIITEPQEKLRDDLVQGIVGLKNAEFESAWRDACREFRRDHPESRWGLPGRPRNQLPTEKPPNRL